MTIARAAWARAGRPVPLTTTEAADVAHVSRWTINRAIARGELAAFRVGRLRRVLDRDLEAWLVSRTEASAS